MNRLRAIWQAVMFTAAGAVLALGAGLVVRAFIWSSGL